jgi:hypothetical protein
VWASRHRNKASLPERGGVWRREQRITFHTACAKYIFTGVALDNIFIKFNEKLQHVKGWPDLLCCVRQNLEKKSILILPTLSSNKDLD